jgi:citrate synthase
MADLQAGLSVLGGRWGLRQLIDIDVAEAKEDLRRLSAAALSLVAQSARGDQPPVPEEVVMQGKTAAERFLLAWRGEVNEKHAKAIDTYWICTAEHGLNASTFTARIVASTGADAGSALSSAVGALSGPLHGGAPARVLPMLDAVAELGDAEKWVEQALARKERIMGFGHRVYRAYDPRAAALRDVAMAMADMADWLDLAVKVEDVALRLLAERHPDRPLKTNVEYYTAAVLQGVKLAPEFYPATFALARNAGWTAHCIEQAAADRIIRPDVRYTGPAERDLPI